MNGRLTQDVKLLDKGFVRAAGELISDSEITPAVWKAWVEEGIIELPDLPQLTAAQISKLRKSRRTRGGLK